MNDRPARKAASQGSARRTSSVPSAHADGDVMYRFKYANLVVTGDLFFPNAFRSSTSRAAGRSTA